MSSFSTAPGGTDAVPGIPLRACYTDALWRHPDAAPADEEAATSPRSLCLGCGGLRADCLQGSEVR